MAERRDSTALGNAGEHLVMAELLARGYQAFWADRGNTAFDISVVAGNKHSLIRVKTSASTHLQWSVKSDGKIFPQMRKSGDYVAIVTFKNGSIRDADVYLVPTHIVDGEIRKYHAHWVAHAPADGVRREGSRAPRQIRRVRLENQLYHIAVVVLRNRSGKHLVRFQHRDYLRSVRWCTRVAYIPPVRILRGRSRAGFTGRARFTTFG